MKMNAKEALADKDTEEALTSVTGIENQLLTLQPQPFIGEFQNKDSIARAEINKAIEDISKIQTEVIKKRTKNNISDL